MSKVLEYTRKGIWLLGVKLYLLIIYYFGFWIFNFIKQGLGITSCLARNDFNVAFSIITLMILTNFYNQFPKATIKIIFQMLAILTLADIVWISLFSGAWEHGQDNKNPSGEIQFWESLWFIHKIVYILAYVELILKGLLLYYLFADFKEKYKLGDLFNFNYDEGKNMVQSQNADQQNNLNNNSMSNFMNESDNSFKEDFHNNY